MENPPGTMRSERLLRRLGAKCQVLGGPSGYKASSREAAPHQIKRPLIEMLTASSKNIPGFVPLLRVTIVALLPKGAPSIRRVAMVENVSVRTLQRRLAEAGYTYSQLVEEVRCDRACHLVADPKARMCDISAALGFSAPSCFTRAFRRWMGMEPRAYRHRILKSTGTTSSSPQPD